VLLFWTLFDSSRVFGTFDGWMGGGLSWLWPVVGFFVLPWTTAAYIFVAPNGLSLIDWVILGIALLLDLGTHGGSGRAYGSRGSRN
jgi:hypothetical protein